MSTRQGSASYTVVIAALASIFVGAIMLTMVLYPIVTAFMNSAIWSAETTHGAMLLSVVGGLWEFWGAIMLIALLAFVWIRTRQ